MATGPRDAIQALVPLGFDGVSRRLISFARRLVQTPSPTGAEHSVSELVAAELRALGYRDIELDENGNVIGRFGPDPPQLMFNGHLDHVDPAGMLDPYGGSILDGVALGTTGPILRGRGSCDMKANVAAGAYAVAYLGAHDKLRGGYVFVADVREEIDGYEGMPSLLDRGLRAKYGLSGESTSLDVAIGHRGKLRFDIRVAGRSAHASRPRDGVNAVYEALPIIAAIDEANARLPADPEYGNATIVVTRVDSEPREDVAVVPAACTIRVDRRYVPAERPDDVEQELRALVTDVASRRGSTAEVKRIGHYPLMAIDRSDPLVGAGLAAVQRVTGRKPGVTTWDFGVNATFMSAAGIPSIGIGPGSERFAHGPDEHVPLAELADAGRIYANLIRELCS
jgi:succinyl-diaminopimelate desuccinylase